MILSWRKQVRMCGGINRIHLALNCLKLQTDARSLESIHDALEEAISGITRSGWTVGPDDENSDLGLDDACDYIEALLGPAFVAVQVYLAAVRSRVCSLARVVKEHGRQLSFVTMLRPHEVLELGSSSVLNGYSDVTVLNAVANFWKHHEEWPTRKESRDDSAELVWDTDNMRKDQAGTARIVAALGIGVSASGQLRTAAESFGVKSPYTDLRPLRDAATTWARDLYELALKETQQLV